MPTQIQLRRGTAAQWTSTNPTLASGELGVETDTGKIKVGSGSTAWTSLPYSGGGIGGSNTQVQYNNAGAFAGSANFVFDGTNVGIGTTSAARSATLTVKAANQSVGSGNGQLSVITSNTQAADIGGQLVLGGQSTAADWVYGTVAGRSENNSYAGYLAFGTSTSGGVHAERMRITSAGNVGIGTTTPGTYLEVASPLGSGSGQININSPGGGGIITKLISERTGPFRISAEGGSGSGITFETGNSVTPVERMRITSGGVVGIANTNPAASATRFAISQPTTPSGTLPTVYLPGGWDNQGAQDNIGTLMQGGSGGTPNGTLLTARIGTYQAFTLNNQGSYQNLLANGRSPVYLYAGSTFSSYGQPNATSAFVTGAPQFAIFTEMSGMYDGYALVGQSIKLTGSYGGASTRDVYCSAVQATTAFGTDRGYGTSYGYYANVSSNITANYAFYAAAGDAAKPGGGSWASTSDARVKNVIGQYAKGLSDVLSLNVIDFTYNGKGGHQNDGRVYTGVIAQEMQEVFPEMVKVHRGKLEADDETDTDILMVDNSALVYALVNAMKELKTIVDAQAARIAALEGN